MASTVKGHQASEVTDQSLSDLGFIVIPNVVGLLQSGVLTWQGRYETKVSYTRLENAL